MLFIQVLAGIWYSISYIPFARRIAINMMRQVPVLRECFSSYDYVSEQAEITSQTLGITKKEDKKKNVFSKMGKLFDSKKESKKDNSFFGFMRDEESQ